MISLLAYVLSWLFGDRPVAPEAVPLDDDDDYEVSGW